MKVKQIASHKTWEILVVIKQLKKIMQVLI